MITNLKAELVPLTLGASAQGQVHRGFQETCVSGELGHESVSCERGQKTSGLAEILCSSWAFCCRVPCGGIDGALILLFW